MARNQRESIIVLSLISYRLLPSKIDHGTNSPRYLPLLLCSSNLLGYRYPEDFLNTVVGSRQTKVAKAHWRRRPIVVQWRTLNTLDPGWEKNGQTNGWKPWLVHPLRSSETETHRPKNKLCKFLICAIEHDVLTIYNSCGIYNNTFAATADFFFPSLRGRRPRRRFIGII